MSDPPILLDVRAVAALLGVSTAHIRRLTDRGAMPRPVALGRCRRWRRGDVVDWIATGCKRVENPGGRR